jgi:hypothetical protein
MTLKEKFLKNKMLTNGEVKIADAFAIGFGEWLEILSNADYGTSEYDIYQKWDVTRLLEIYKKEKGL